MNDDSYIILSHIKQCTIIHGTSTSLFPIHTAVRPRTGDAPPLHPRDPKQTTLKPSPETRNEDINMDHN